MLLCRNKSFCFVSYFLVKFRQTDRRTVRGRPLIIWGDMVKFARKFNLEGLQEKSWNRSSPKPPNKFNQEVHQEKKIGTRGTLKQKVKPEACRKKIFTPPPRWLMVDPLWIWAPRVICTGRLKNALLKFWTQTDRRFEVAYTLLQWPNSCNFQMTSVPAYMKPFEPR